MTSKMTSNSRAPSQVHHFNPGGNVPAWLMNWLAEGKPIAFVRRLEEVAVKWDEQALTMKSMPCKGRGFGESSSASFFVVYCLSGPGIFVLLFGLLCLVG